MILEKPDKKSMVVRANKLIESRYRLSVAERRFMLWIVSQISKNDTELKPYTISVKDFVEFAGLKQNDNYYALIANMADKLTQRNIGVKDDEKQRIIYFSWFDEIEYDWGNGQITAILHKKLTPFLLQLKEQYTKISLEYALLLNGSYASRIYDLLKQYERIGSREIMIDDLKDMLEIKGKYQKYPDFRRRVIEASQSEINSKTDIAFEWLPIKKSRKVVAIKFMIMKNNPVVTTQSVEYTNQKAHTLMNRLQKRHGVSEKAARDLINAFDCDRIGWHIKDYEKQLKSGKDLNPGWLVTAIKTDHRPQQSLFQKEQKQAQEGRKKQVQLKNIELGKLAILKDKKLKVEQTYRAHCKTVRDKLLSSLFDIDKDRLKQEFLETIVLDFNRAEFEGSGKMQGWNSILNNVEIRKFWVDKFPDEFLSIDEIAKNYEIENWQIFLAKLEKLNNN